MSNPPPVEVTLPHIKERYSSIFTKVYTVRPIKEEDKLLRYGLHIVAERACKSMEDASVRSLHDTLRICKPSNWGVVALIEGVLTPDNVEAFRKALAAAQTVLKASASLAAILCDDLEKPETWQASLQSYGTTSNVLLPVMEQTYGYTLNLALSCLDNDRAVAHSLCSSPHGVRISWARSIRKVIELVVAGIDAATMYLRNMAEMESLTRDPRHTFYHAWVAATVLEDIVAGTVKSSSEHVTLARRRAAECWSALSAADQATFTGVPAWCRPAVAEKKKPSASKLVWVIDDACTRIIHGPDANKAIVQLKQDLHFVGHACGDEKLVAMIEQTLSRKNRKLLYEAVDVLTRHFVVDGIATARQIAEMLQKVAPHIELHRFKRYSYYAWRILHRSEEYTLGVASDGSIAERLAKLSERERAVWVDRIKTVADLWQGGAEAAALMVMSAAPPPPPPPPPPPMEERLNRACRKIFGRHTVTPGLALIVNWTLSDMNALDSGQGGSKYSQHSMLWAKDHKLARHFISEMIRLGALERFVKAMQATLSKMLSSLYDVGEAAALKPENTIHTEAYNAARLLIKVARTFLPTTASQ